MIVIKQEDFKLYSEKNDIRVESDYILESEKRIDELIHFNINVNKLNNNIKLNRQQLKDLAEVLTELSKLI